jgi:hypothetical protein
MNKRIYGLTITQADEPTMGEEIYGDSATIGKMLPNILPFLKEADNDIDLPLIISISEGLKSIVIKTVNGLTF